VRRWLWPYAILVIALTLAGIAALAALLLGLGPGELAVRLTVVDTVVIAPTMHLLISFLDMIAPFDLPGWFKQVYAILALIAIAGMVLSAVAGLLLLPVFYALYRDAGR